VLEGSTLGTLVELMVRAEILAGSEGRLIPSRFEPDVDYRERSSHADRVTLQFSCRATGDVQWDSFEVARLQLAGVLEPIVGAAGPATVEELISLRG
jgi:hypothetical protein